MPAEGTPRILAGLSRFLGRGRSSAIGVNQFSAFAGEGYLEDGQGALGHTLSLELEEIGRARHDSLRLGCAVIHVDQHEAVGIGMRKDGRDLADDYGFCVPPVADGFDGRDLETGERESLRQVGDWDVDVYVFFEPGKRR